MELVTKILSSSFFSIFTDMIKIANNWKEEACPKEKLDFNIFVKKRLLLLSKFQFKPIKNFNLSLCLRLQFLLQNHLIACLDEKSLQVYSQYLCKENKKLIFSIIQNEKNFEIILKELYKHNYAHLEFLIEVFYALKNNVDSFLKIQGLLNSLGFMDLISSLLSQIEFKAIDNTIFLDIKNHYFLEKQHFMSFLELIMFFIYKNKNCFLLKIFPNSSTITKSEMLRFLFTLPFQSTFPKSNIFVLRIIEIIVSNMNELVDDPVPYRKHFVTAFNEVVEQYNLYNHPYFFYILEMLINNKEFDTLKVLLNKIDIWPYLIDNMNFESKKTICSSLVKISSCMLNKMEIWPDNEKLAVMINKWVRYLKKDKYNVLSSCLFEVIQDVYGRSGGYLEKALPGGDFAEFKRFVKVKEVTEV